MNEPIEKAYLSFDKYRSFDNPDGAECYRAPGVFWKRAHRDWRLWFCMIVLLAPIAAYLIPGIVRR